MSPPPITFSGVAVLTGAGFTKNFGGFDSREMRQCIQGHSAVKNTPRIKALLDQEENFETAYASVIDNTEFTPEEIGAFRIALESAYKVMEERICTCHMQSTTMHLSRLGQLVHTISKYTGSERAFWFTLNQDLFLERQKRWKAAGVPDLFTSESQRLNPAPPQSYRLPDAEKSRDLIQAELSGAIQGHVGPAYIKLHGSMSWESYTGKPGMVLGINKMERIRAEPLLDEYYKIFEGYFQEENRRLVVIGYSFRDQHINDVLLDAVRRGLRLIVVSTGNEAAFRENLQSNDWGDLADVSEYFQSDMKNLFEHDADLLRRFNQAIVR